MGVIKRLLDGTKEKIKKFDSPLVIYWLHKLQDFLDIL